jgi:hypothetical protein
MSRNRQILAAGLLIFLSRVPFLFDGYGSEEDAWALRLVAERIATTGVYEVSRLPGHPLQELVYAAMWNSGSVFFNLVTALISSAGVVFFIRALDKLNMPNAITAGFLLASVPVVYINSTNAMDYTWAMAFVLASFYFLTDKRFVPAGIFLALAVGCRITSAVFGLPFLYFIYQYYPGQNRIAMMRFVAAASIAALVVYAPVFKNYGLSFFTFYEHFPIPGFSKNFYKGVIAVWGLPMLFAAVPLVWLQLRDSLDVQMAGRKKLLLFCVIAVIPVILLFLRVPLKSAFMIPLVPFVILASALFFNKLRLQLLLLSAVVSCFMFGINLDDAKRGSAKSNAGIAFTVSKQPVVFDPFQGLLTADRSKRIQRTAFARKVLHSALTIQKPVAVIAGWWLADILVLEKEGVASGIEWLYYTDEARLRELQSQHIQLYYLPQQDTFNDLRFDKVFTHDYVQPFPLVP